MPGPEPPKIPDILCMWDLGVRAFAGTVSNLAGSMFVFKRKKLNIFPLPIN